ncbi:MAG: Luciferase-like monooxygenase YhbW [uncultured Thermomicrobiales bacterium]|uniref:Luciferase-like monooxygenase n=1 Tax=uncultured Thermomicrobiales bacterium TaxID=1645740 RepID=A0A6J4VRG5_9BACT|nr:MAG: Luciferase-like monooxygenase YhbW [uncultured Thermomicrobiales bacterium]
MPTLPLSILDLAPIGSGSTATEALRNALDLARLADRLGYTRLWYAEHHNMPGVASSAPEILIGAAARETTRLRVGSGGVMLPNHPPLKVVEWFRTLEALYPGRIDLGIGRAPGTDGLTALALRRSREALTSDDFTAHLAELLAFANGDFPDDHPFRQIRATPIDVPLPPLWLLGSSDYSAQVAGMLGVGFAFARHINPDGAEEAIGRYREEFSPSETLAGPRVILATSVICADTDAEADRLATSADLSFLRLRSGRPGLLPSPEEAQAYPYTSVERAQVGASRARHLIGTPVTIRPRLQEIIARVGADEVMITSSIHAHTARLRSFTLLAEAFGLVPQPTPVPAEIARA